MENTQRNIWARLFFIQKTMTFTRAAMCVAVPSSAAFVATHGNTTLTYASVTALAILLFNATSN